MSDRDAKRLVFDGYDAMCDRYERVFGHSGVRNHYLDALKAGLARQAHVLDLGCGSGNPVVVSLVASGMIVTGVDGSLEQVLRARRNVPTAKIVHGDMMSIELPSNSFDAICAFHSLNHLPRAEHRPLLSKVLDWLRPGGRFVGSFGVDGVDWYGEWLGQPMYFSANDPNATKAMFTELGFELISFDVVAQDNEDASFLWVIARKPEPK